MDSKKIGSLRVEVARKEVRFINEADGIGFCYARIRAEVGVFRDEIGLPPRQAIQRSYKPGRYFVLVYSWDLISFTSKIQMALGVPIDIAPLVKYFISRIDKREKAEEKELGIKDVIACYEGTQYLQGLTHAGNHADFEADIVGAVKVAAGFVPSRGSFVVDDDPKRPERPPRPRQAEVVRETRETYKDSYQKDEESLFGRIFKGRKTSV